MIKTLQHLKNGIIDNGCYTSDDFKKFVRTFRSEFKKEVAKIGGENVEIKVDTIIYMDFLHLIIKHII